MDVVGIILAIDPGDTKSAFCFVDKNTYRPIFFAKQENHEAVASIEHFIENLKDNEHIVGTAIEMVASYGMSVGAHVFVTCTWIGRFSQILEDMGYSVDWIYRKEEKMHICGQMKAKDSNIRTALIDRFAQHDFKTGKGTKKEPDWFFGFAADVWQSYAVAVTYIDTHLNSANNIK